MPGIEETGKPLPCLQAYPVLPSDPGIEDFPVYNGNILSCQAAKGINYLPRKQQDSGKGLNQAVYYRGDSVFEVISGENGRTFNAIKKGYIYVFLIFIIYL